MIISQTPYRVSFAGGGTDLPAFHRHEFGAVLSTTIDREAKDMHFVINYP
jgi:D-glycero-alpha-D-manno-heptose-7-phosphate kinase